MVLSAVGLVVLLMPRFRPHVPAWAETVVPPRYRRAPEASPDAQEAVAGSPPGTEGERVDPGEREPGAGEEAEQPVRQAAAERRPSFAGLHGATALGARRRDGVERRP